MRNICIGISLIFFLSISCGTQQKSLVNVIEKEFRGEITKNVISKKLGELPQISAHRGGIYPKLPENCIETMEYVISFGVKIFEVDIASSKDSVLFLMHDNTLGRTTTGIGKVGEKFWKDLKKLSLVDKQKIETKYKIPSFTKVLKWAKKNNVIITVDKKESVSWNDIIVEINESDAIEQCVLITYAIEEAMQLYEKYPEYALSTTIRNDEEFYRVKHSGIPLNQLMAFTGTGVSNETLYNDIEKNGILVMLGTFGNLDNRAVTKGDSTYLDYVEKGVHLIATDRPVEVAKVLIEKR